MNVIDRIKFNFKKRATKYFNIFVYSELYDFNKYIKRSKLNRLSFVCVCSLVYIDRERDICQIYVSVFHLISFYSSDAFWIVEQFEGDFFHSKRKHVEVWIK